MNITAVYPGSFDPITFGHIDIIQRLEPLFANLIVLVANSPNKHYVFKAEERAQLIRENCQLKAKTQVEVSTGLTVDFARARGASVIVRGLRAIADFEYETAIANVNARLDPRIETMIVFTRPEYSYISSKIVKEVAYYGGDLNDLVPESVAQALRAKISEVPNVI